MRGIGGPLLCIGDLLNDVGDEPVGGAHPHPLPHPSTSLSSPSSPLHSLNFQPSHLSLLFQENYDQLNKALTGSDHSWTSLTLKLCSALDTAKKLIDSSNSNALMLSEKVAELEKMIKKGDAAIAEVRSIHSSLSQRIAASSDNSLN